MPSSETAVVASWTGCQAEPRRPVLEALVRRCAGMSPRRAKSYKKPVACWDKRAACPRQGRLGTTDRDAASVVPQTLPAAGDADAGSVGTALAQRAGVPLRGGFDLSDLRVPAEEILPGGPPKDGIPALTNPKLIPARDASYLRPQDRVIGYVADGEARAYPLKILNYHEIVNDRVADVPIAVTYCPLCDSVAVFDRRTPLGERVLGVSGLLYNSNVLMYDRGGTPESLWSQLQAAGISGPAAGKPLRALPVELTTWQDWRMRYPGTCVLSPQTGHRRNYERNPYHGYFAQPALMFPAHPTSDRLPAKARAQGVWTSGAPRAYPESAFSRQRSRVEDEIRGKKVVIAFNPDAGSLRMVHAEEGVQWKYALWFA